VQETEAWRRRHESRDPRERQPALRPEPESGAILWDGDTSAVLGIPASEISTRAQVDGARASGRPDAPQGLRELFSGGEISTSRSSTASAATTGSTPRSA
jgi:hypothetical protein